MTKTYYNTQFVQWFNKHVLLLQAHTSWQNHYCLSALKGRECPLKADFLFQIELDQPVCLDCSHVDNISCQLDADGAGVHCQDENCPYKEEKHPISLTVYIHSYSRLEAYTKSFYLREIGTSAQTLWLALHRMQKWSFPCSFWIDAAFCAAHQDMIALVDMICSNSYS